MQLILLGLPGAAGYWLHRTWPARARCEACGTLVPRDFLSLPTARGERRFVYATPKGHQPNEADAVLKSEVDRVFADYMRRRARHIAGNDSANVLALVREWFDDGGGVVKPSNVWRTRTTVH